MVYGEGPAIARGVYIRAVDTAARAQMEGEDGENHLIAWTLLVFIAIFALIFANTDEEMPSGRYVYRGQEQDDFLDLDDFDS